MPALETMESILVALWRASWQASLLILLVLLAQATLRRWLSPAWRSALWLLVVARLLLPFTPPSNWSLFNLTSHFNAHRATALDPPAVIEPERIEAPASGTATLSLRILYSTLIHARLALLQPFRPVRHSKLPSTIRRWDWFAPPLPPNRTSGSPGPALRLAAQRD